MQPRPDRMQQVLDAAARGLTVAETGAELYLSVNTVKSWRRLIIERYGARNLTQAVAIWAAAGAPADLRSEAAGVHRHGIDSLPSGPLG